MTCLQIQSKLPSSGSKIKTSFVFSKTKVFLLNADGRYSLLNRSVLSRGEIHSRLSKHHSGPRPVMRSLQPSLLHVVDNCQDAHLLLGRVHILVLLLGHTGA